MNEEVTIENARELSEKYISEIPSYPDTYEGRGIVICAGGTRLFTSAWVCINILRKQLGCNLPIELWYLGPKEVDSQMIKLLKPLNVTCIDGLEVRKKHPSRRLGGWELKAFAMIHSSFKEVLLLDADNVPVVNPEYLFTVKEYKTTGAIFWPDLNRLLPDRAIWSICGIPYKYESEFESGQIVINKKTCWDALNLSMWYNEYSDFFYKHVHGDKETFHLAFRKLNKSYTMVSWPVILIAGVLYQHGIDGSLVFQHRNGPKWNYNTNNPIIPGFQFQQECLQYIDELKAVWDGNIRRDFTKVTGRLKHIVEGLTLSSYNYHRVGYDSRHLSFSKKGTIEAGKANMEAFWDIYEDGEDVYLEIIGEKIRTCVLKLNEGNVWKGEWLHFERMPIELSPVK